MRRIVLNAVTLFLFFTFVGSMNKANAIAVRTLILTTEYEELGTGPVGTNVQYKVGYPFGSTTPQQMTLCAVAVMDDAPAVGVTITFTVSPLSDPGWVISSQTAVTNSQGQAIIQVTSCPTVPQKLGLFKASWTAGLATITASHSLSSDVGDTPTVASPTFGAVFASVPALGIDPKAIRWDAPSDYHAYYASGFAAWQSASAGRVAFVESPSNPQYKITDIDDEFTQGYASTTYPAPPSPILATTKNNRFYLDGMPLRDGSPYPPRSVRHHIDSTATHEIGHALGFQHNFVDKCALMNWGGVRWFVSGTKTPTQDELTSLAILYPNP